MGEVAHRPDRVTALTGLPPDAILTSDDVATILLHPNGGLRGVPNSARVLAAITKVTSANQLVAAGLVERIAAHLRIDRAIGIPDQTL